MSCVDRAERRQLFGQLHDFVGGRRVSVGVGQTGGQAQRASLKTLPQLLTHTGNFIWRCCAKKIVKVIAAQRGVPDQRRDIQCGIRRFDRRAIVAECRINKRGSAAEQVHRVRRIAAQTHRRRTDPAVADDHRSHTLTELGQHLRLADHHRVVVGVHIDEAWRQHLAGRVDFFAGVCVVQVADALNAPVENRYIGGVTGAVAAVDDQGVADQRVVHHVSLPAAGDRRRRGNRPGRV
ncbi:hypothetical protein D3C86_816080 [compost metagenome]